MISGWASPLNTGCVSHLGTYTLTSPLVLRRLGRTLRQIQAYARAGNLRLGRGTRELALGLAFTGMAALGLAGLLDGDELGLVYILPAVPGLLFRRNRLLPTAVWLGATAWVTWSFLLGNRSALVLVLVGLVATAVAARAPGPLAEPDASDPRQHASPSSSVVMNGWLPQADRKQSAGQLTIQTLGSLKVFVDGRELTKELADRPLLSFLWLLLLTRALGGAAVRVPRTELADELAAGLDSGEQRRRLRGQLYDLQHDLPPSLGQRVITNSQDVWLELSGCQVDVLDLRALEAHCAGNHGLLEPTLMERVTRALSSEGDYLAGWEELERRITSGRGTSGAAVAELRQRVNQQRASLAACLGRAYRLQGESAVAAPYFEQAVHQSGGREDYARSLIGAYLESGQQLKALDFRRKYDLGEEI